MIPLGLLGPLGMWEIVLILVIVVFLFGARRIPEIARGMGEGIRGFRSSLRGGGDEGEGDEPEPSKKADGPAATPPGSISESVEWPYGDSYTQPIRVPWNRRSEYEIV